MKPVEIPRNGIAGLKHWRYDLLAGLQVALVSLPLSLGIAIASGAPPVAGVISAIIAGLIFPFLGGAYVTISGPAAGLAPALLAGILMLGDGDLAVGYPLVLVAIFITGIVQIILSLLKAGKLVAMFLPIAVVEAMLAAIGLMIIVKQIPMLMGVTASPAGSTFASLASLPSYLVNLDPIILGIGGLSLFLMFYLNRSRHAWLRRIPAPLTVCGIGIALAYLTGLDSKYLISMPENIIEGGITLPAFGEVLNRPELWAAVVIIVITLTLIDSIESMATISAVDKIDPYQRKSDPNITMRAMGVSNALSSMAGGLTIIPGGIKSRANIDAGGRTLWANFYNAVALIIFLVYLKEIITLIPLAAIASILIYVGWRLCEPSVFAKTFSVGRDQITIFVFTVLAVLTTDLLTGIILGVIAEIIVLVYMLTPSIKQVLTGRLTFTQLLTYAWKNLITLFRSPVIRMKEENNQEQRYHLSLSSLVGFNLLALERTLVKIPEPANISLNLTESGQIIDHTSMEYLHQMREEYVRKGREFEVLGLDKFQPFTDHPFAARMRDTQFVKEEAKRSAREQTMAMVAQRFEFSFSNQKRATLNRHGFIYLQRGSDREESNVMTGKYHECPIRLFDYSHRAAPDYYVEYLHTLAMISPPDHAQLSLPNFSITPGSYLERYLVIYEEIDVSVPEDIAAQYRFYTDDPDRFKQLLVPDMMAVLQRYPGYYLEVRDNILLVFNPKHELEPPNEITTLLSFSTLFSIWAKQPPPRAIEAQSDA